MSASVHTVSSNLGPYTIQSSNQFNSPTTIVADKINLGGIEITAGPSATRYKASHYPSATTPTYNFSSYFAVNSPTESQPPSVTEYVNIKSFTIETSPTDIHNRHVIARSVSAHNNQTSFICAEDMLYIVEDIYQRINDKTNITICNSTITPIAQKVDSFLMKLSEIQTTIDKQTHNMTVLYQMLEQQKLENIRLKKKIQDLEADIA